MDKQVKNYVEKFMAELIAKNPGEKEFHQAVSEVVESVAPYIQFSHSVVSNSFRPHEPQHARPPRPSPTPGVHPNPCPLSQWCHPTSSSSVVLFSPCPQSLLASRTFPMSQLLASVVQSIGVSASTSVPPMNIQDWSPLGWTGWISLQSKGLSRVFSNTTVQKHQFFSAQLFFIVQLSHPYETLQMRSCHFTFSTTLLPLHFTDE